jgi:hypothetical protein
MTCCTGSQMASCEHSNEPLGSVKGGKDSAPWR